MKQGRGWCAGVSTAEPFAPGALFCFMDLFTAKQLNHTESLAEDWQQIDLDSTRNKLEPLSSLRQVKDSKKRNYDLEGRRTRQQ